MRVHVLFLFILIASSTYLKAQQILEKYIQEGLRNNEAIKQQQFLLQKNLLALRESKAMFLPTSSLNGLYTRAQGGRSFDLPLGDLLNPAYNTLNKMTGTNNFPQVDNKKILFNPNDFYDVKVHTTIPLVNAEIFYNEKIRKELISFQNAEVNVYKRELIKDIKTAYFKYWQADQAVRIYEQALKLVNEGNRINKSLQANGRANRTSASRAATEISKVEASLNESLASRENSKMYFNFLLNRGLNEEIQIDEAELNDEFDFSRADTSILKRDELKKTASALQISSYSNRLAKSYLVPKVGVFFDMGSQGFQWQVNQNSMYYFGGVTLEWNLFSFGRNSLRASQVEQDFKIVKSQKDATVDQLSLQLSMAVKNYEAARSNYTSAIDQVKSAENYYTDILRLYSEGRAMYIELLDAQNQYTEAQMKESISKCAVLIRTAEIERSISSYNLNTK